MFFKKNFIIHIIVYFQFYDMVGYIQSVELVFDCDKAVWWHVSVPCEQVVFLLVMWTCRIGMLTCKIVVSTCSMAVLTCRRTAIN